MTILERRPGRTSNLIDTEANWTSRNPIIYRGETCYVVDDDGIVTGYKVGLVAWPVGSHWLDLEYGIIGPTGLTGPPDGYQGVWDSGTTYDTGETVIGSDNVVYLSKIDSNTNHDPTADDGSHWSSAGGTAGALIAANNLSDLSDASDARDNLGLGDSATKAVGTTAGTVAAGDDSRITGAAPLASPAFTGHPTGVTESTSDSSTRLATTALVSNKIAALSGAPLNVAFCMPGAATVRDGVAVWVAPYACHITGFRALVDSGSTTVVQLKKNGSTIGSGSSGLTTSVASTTFTSVGVSAGDVIRLTITTAGTGVNVQASLIGTVD